MLLFYVTKLATSFKVGSWQDWQISTDAIQTVGIIENCVAFNQALRMFSWDLQ